MSHKIAHVSDSPLNAKTSRPDAVVWGPIDGPTAERLGLSSEVESRLIQPAAPEVARAAEAVLKLVPKNVLPVEGDTAESLVARLESSDWLDGMEVKEGGHGKGGRYVLLNSEEYPQPRRKSWSVLVKEEMEDEDGDHVHWLLAYKVPAKKSSWHCTVTAQHPAPRAAHRHTSPLRLRGGGARKIRETVGGTRCAPHTKGLLGYFIGRTLKQEQVYVDVVKEVAPGHPALSPLGEILPFCRELPGADYLSEDPHEETQHTLSVEQWLAYVSGQRTQASAFWCARCFTSSGRRSTPTQRGRSRSWWSPSRNGGGCGITMSIAGERACGTSTASKGRGTVTAMITKTFPKTTRLVCLGRHSGNSRPSTSTSTRRGAACYMQLQSRVIDACSGPRGEMRTSTSPPPTSCHRRLTNQSSTKCGCMTPDPTGLRACERFCESLAMGMCSMGRGGDAAGSASADAVPAFPFRISISPCL